jgi:hypothetical protein
MLSVSSKVEGMEPLPQNSNFSTAREAHREGEPLPATGSLDSTSAGVTPANPGTTYRTEPATPRLPKPATGTVGNYELIEEVDRGGMGIIYKARDRHLGRIVALKMMKLDAGPDSAQARRFDREVRSAAKLFHPNIVPVFEVGEHEGRPYYTMAFMAAGSLAKHRAQYEGDPQSAALVMEKIARALHHAHENGIYHRDLKPANVLIDDRGEPMVSDFGLAKAREADLELTQTGMHLGTPPYMSPEQIAGKSQLIGAGADIWAMGIMLYELLAGKRPFVGQDSEELKNHILQTDPPSVRAAKPKLDRTLEAIVRKALEKDLRRRYVSAADLADDLAAWREGRQTKVRPEGLRSKTSRMMRRHPRAVTLAGVLAVAALLLLVVLPLLDPERTERIMERSLLDGQVVNLLAAKGRPFWQRFLVGRNSTTTGLAEDGSFELSGWVDSAMTLLKDPRIPSYRFRAQVRHANSINHGRVGVFFLHHDFPFQGGRGHFFYELVFNDIVSAKENYDLFIAPKKLRIPRPAGNAVSLTPYLLWEREDRISPGSQPGEGKQVAIFEPGGLSRTRWRSLAVEITPKNVAIFWEDKHVADLSRDVAEETFRQLYAKLVASQGLEPAAGPVPARLCCRESLGILVSHGDALFRNLAVEPLEASITDYGDQ